MSRPDLLALNIADLQSILRRREISSREVIEAIDPKSWNTAELHKELSRALSTVDDARAEYSTQRSRLQGADQSGGDPALPEVAPDVSDLLNGGRTFGQWMRIGFAFSLPLIFFGFIALLIFFWMASRGP